jgi:hypothetical protein
MLGGDPVQGVTTHLEMELKALAFYPSAEREDDGVRCDAVPVGKWLMTFADSHREKATVAVL